MDGENRQKQMKNGKKPLQPHPAAAMGICQPFIYLAK